MSKGSLVRRQKDSMRPNSGSPLIIVVAAICAMLVLATLLVGALQLSPACREWRAWKASKQGPGFHTMELMIPPPYCIGSRDPTQ